jgi:exosortase
LSNDGENGRVAGARGNGPAVTFGWRTAIFAAYCLGIIAANVGVLRSLAVLSRQDATASHVLLIPLVTLVLIFQQRRSIFGPGRLRAVGASARPAGVGWDWRAGLGVIAAGLGLSWLAGSVSQPSGQLNDALALPVLAIVILWIGGFVLAFGRESSRRAMFPLLFLCFMVPIPGILLNGAVGFLKRGSAEMVAALFTLTGTVYHREGFVFSLPNVVIEVADECSGIRSSLALVMTVLLAGHMFLSSTWKKVVLVLAVIPLTIVKNSIRIVTLTLLAVHVNPSFLTGQLHHEGGILFFLIALALFSPLFRLLQRSEPPHQVRTTAADSP